MKAFASHNIKSLLIFLFCFFFFGLHSTSANMTATDGTSSNKTTTTTLVVGATGATGKWVVKLLLDQNQKVKVVARSEERMLKLLQELSQDETISYADRLTVTEASLLNLSDEEWKDQVEGCDAVVSCLGHNMDFKGIWGRDSKQLVTKATTRLTSAIAATTTPTKKTKFILMGSDGVANPNGKDDKRSFMERTLISVLRVLIPPHSDNEGAAAVVHALGKSDKTIEWSVVRPTDLIDGEPTGKFQLFEKPKGSLFGAGTATRSNVAQCMVDFILNEDKWEQYKFQMPVLHDIPTEEKTTEL